MSQLTRALSDQRNYGPLGTENVTSGVLVAVQMEKAIIPIPLIRADMGFICGASNDHIERFAMGRAFHSKRRFTCMSFHLGDV